MTTRAKFWQILKSNTQPQSNMNINYIKLGQIGAEAARAKNPVCNLLELDPTVIDTWKRDRDAHTAYAQAVVRGYLEQVGEGFPAVGDCLQSFPPSPTVGQGVEAIRSLMLASFAKKMESVSKLPERWEKPDSIGAYYVCAADLRNALSIPAVEVVPAEKWAKEKAAHAQGRKIESRTPSGSWGLSKEPQWLSGIEYRIAPEQPAQPGKLTDADLGETGTKAVAEWMAKMSGPISEGNPQAIFAHAVRKAVEKEQGEEIREVCSTVAKQCAEIARLMVELEQAQAMVGVYKGNCESKTAEFTALESRYREMTDLLQECVQKHKIFGRGKIDRLVVDAVDRLTEDRKGLAIELDNTRERLVKAEKKAESKHGFWMQELSKAMALEKQLVEALPWRETAEKWRDQCQSTEAQLATVTAERDRLQWRPVSEKPTLDDAGKDDRLLKLHNGVAMFASIKNLDGASHWMPCPPPPALTAEEVERERFEKWAQDKPHLALNRSGCIYGSSATQNAWDAWKAARASKEGPQ